MTRNLELGDNKTSWVSSSDSTYWFTSAEETLMYSCWGSGKQFCKALAMTVWALKKKKKKYYRAFSTPPPICKG